MIVFLEANCFDINALSDCETNIIITIKPIETPTKDKFSMSVCSKNNVPVCIPKLPDPPHFSLEPTLREFLLLKCLSGQLNGKNAENRELIKKTREIAFAQLYEDYKKSKEINDSGRAFYEIGKEIGRGATGVVHEVVHKSTGQIYCMKIIHKDRIRDQALLLRTSKEMKLLKRLNHPNICRGYKQFEDNNELCFLLEM